MARGQDTRVGRAERDGPEPGHSSRGGNGGMIRTIAATFGTRTFIGLGNLGLSLALARVLGPERQGAISYLLVLVNLLTLLGGLGLDATAVVFLNRMGLSARQYVRTVLTTLLSSLAILTVGAFILFQMGLMGGGVHQGPMMLAIALLMVPFELGIQLSRSLLLARERIREYNRVEWTQAISLYVLLGLALFFGRDKLEWTLLMYLASRLLAAFRLLVVFRHFPLDPPERDQPKDLPLRKVLSYSVWPWLANVFSLLYTRVDTLMIAWFATRVDSVEAADLGLYTICTLAVTRLQDVQTAVQVSFFPHVAGLDAPGAVRATGKFYRFTTPVYWFVFLAVIVVGWPILWIFGPAYTTAYPVLLVLAAGILAIRANSGVLSLFFTAQNRPEVPALVNATALLVAAGINAWLIPVWGILGAAFGTLIACLVAKGLLVLIYLRAGGRYNRDLLMKGADLNEAVIWLRTRWLRWTAGRGNKHQD